jgi:hypothetical protein
MNTWNLREEILIATQRWYRIMAGFLIGMLLGWLVSFIWPAPYRAIVDVYVGLNAYRSNRDLYVMEVAENEFRNRDDYKNWQMNQLDALAFSDAYLEETLNRLQAQDSYWQSLDMLALRDLLDLAWRNTGEWHFMAVTDTTDHSAQAAVAWSEVVIEKANTSIAAAESMIPLDSRLNALDQALVAAKTRQKLLEDTISIILEWNISLVDSPSDKPLPPQDHWSLLSTVAVAADWTPGWVVLLETAPPLGAFPVDYDTWLEQVNALTTAELALLPAQIKSFETEYDQVVSEYDLAAMESRALSAGLEVSQIKEQSPEIVHLRPVGALMLIGGILGLLTWMVVWLYQITRRTER